MSSITTPITSPVTIVASGATPSPGSYEYPSALTITSSGSVVLGADGATAISSTTSGVTLFNNSEIYGGGGMNATTAGAGVDLTAYGIVYNDGHIHGGWAGGGGDGGVGVSMTDGILFNGSLIEGGTGSGAGNSGGDGVDSTDVSVNNNNEYDTIIGGEGQSGANGGVGVRLDGGSVVNSKGTIVGGYANGSGAGGAGVVLTRAGLITLAGVDGLIDGGNSLSGAGGVAVFEGAGSEFMDLGFMGVYGGSDFNRVAPGGAGAYVGADALFLDGRGIIQGGIGDIGGVGVELNGGTLENEAGIIAGGGGASIEADAVEFGSNATSTLEAGTGATFVGDIGGFAPGDKIILFNLTPDEITKSGSATAGSYELKTADGNFSFSGTYTQDFSIVAVASQAGTETEITLPCYVRGTQIRTAAGDVAVEHLKIGDAVITASGALRPVRWLGSRAIDCSGYADPASVWPICIRAGAFAEHQPVRDLWVSPGHAVFIDGVLIQAGKLVNGVTIMQLPRERVEYWHVELDAHDVILAEGLPAESYLDTGNRTAFVNGGEYLEARPDFAPKHWSETCVPLVLEGPALQQAKAALLARAQALGHEVTQDADLHVLADGKRIDPVRLGDARHVRWAFMLPASSRLELRSRTFIPAYVNANSGDIRSLGICVGRLQLDGSDMPLETDKLFKQGWHRLEGNSQDRQWRWTKSSVPLPAGTRLVVIDLGGRGYYWARPGLRIAACG